MKDQNPAESPITWSHLDLLSFEQEQNRGDGVTQQTQIHVAHQGDGRPAAAGGEEAGPVPAETAPPGGLWGEDRCVVKPDAVTVSAR